MACWIWTHRRRPQRADIAQALSGQTLSENLGVIQRGEPIIPGVLSPRGAPGVRYARSGLAPEWGLVVDWFDGKTFLGEDLGYNTESAWKIAKRNLIPLVGQDAWEAFDEAGWWGLATVPYAFFGGGVQAYGGDPSSQLRGMPRFVGVAPEMEREIREARTLMEIEHDRVQTAGLDTTQAELARSMADDPFYADKKDAFLFLAKDLSGDLKHDPATINFALENAGVLDDQTLAFALNESEARNALKTGKLSQEDFDRRSVWIAEN